MRLKMAAIMNNIFKCIFQNENCCISIIFFIEIGAKWFNSPSSIGSENGLVPSRRTTIIQTKDYFLYRRIYVSVGLDMLIMINYVQLR